MSIRKDIRIRVYVAFTVICLFGVAIIARATYIYLKYGTELIAKAKKKQTHVQTLTARRGSIVTEDGILLSTSIPWYDVRINFSYIDKSIFAKKIDTLCECMARIFPERSQESFKEEFVHAYENKEHYYPLKKGLFSYEEFDSIRQFPIFNERLKGKNCFMYFVKDTREYPYGHLANRALGVYSDSKSTGIENYYDSVLRGVNGRQMVQKSVRGVPMPVPGTIKEPINGRDLVTTLDINIQKVADDFMRSALDKFKCEYGTCIVMEVKTGKVRAMVNLGMKKDSTYDEIFNYAIQPSEPGSTFKLATLVSLFNDRYVTTETEVDAENGTKLFGKRPIRDAHSGIGRVPVWKAFAKSSNVAMAKLANEYYRSNPTKFTNHLMALRLNMPTGIDLTLLKDLTYHVNCPGDKLWTPSSVLSLAIGYEVMISPLHTCMMYNALANDGKMMRPYLVSSIREYGKDIVTIEPKVVATLGDANVIRQLKKCTRAVVSADGTAKEIQSPWYTMAGKTGTAKVKDNNILYEDGIYQGSFVGYFPAEAPKYTVCVVIRTLKHSKAYYGGAIAAPVFKMIADKIFSMNIGAWDAPLDSLSRSGSWRLTAGMATASNYQTLLNGLHQRGAVPGDYMNKMMQLRCDSNRRLTLQPVKIYPNVVPDVKGMGLKDAVYMLENNGLKVKIRGKGRVQAQSLLPGTKINKGDGITLQLS